ncbi:MAG: hypothetical protein AAFN81_29295 [Bacteroidota bacterium]
MRDILDETNDPAPVSSAYSRLALAIGVIATSLLFWIYSYAPSNVNGGYFNWQPPPRILTILYLLFFVLGVGLTIASVQRGEPWTWYKILGTILNLILLVFFLGTVIFAQVVDNF